MKQNENESKYSKKVTYILVAIIASIFIGIRIYTKHIERQNKEILEKIMQCLEKIPMSVSSRNSRRHTL